MPKVIGGLMALVALAASTLAQVDPWTTLLRGVIAYMVGGFATQLWYVFFTVRVQTAKEPGSETETSPTLNSEFKEEPKVAA